MTPYARSLLGLIGVAVLISVSAAQQPQQSEQPPAKKPDLGPMVSVPENTVIKLDPNDPNLEVWRDRDTSRDPKREPGPIGPNGALTFFGLPIAITTDDLKAGKVEVAIIGAPVDMGVGFRGAGEGQI